MKQPLTHLTFRLRPSNLQSGFTLMEMVLVVSIIAVLVGVAINKMGGALDTSKKVACQASMQSVNTQLKLYNGLNGFYPTTEQGLKALVVQPTTEPRPRNWSQGSETVPVDPWYKEFNYVCPGKHNPKTYDLFSCGPDRLPNTDDDVCNWEAAPAASN